ncbi:unnamed protein product [Bursaphelenchus xylophilus]|uniref:(pine wood nematode) hypothetical protein n=1 Tax=Bursaphelenchus xylophilus TaxID=6326 RepID=A0A7I8WKG9_BURXY|nr:unnamed protein product [Bursaphelenchus xylophilus]CAG9106732.1 unnamed protein product [Bursaphelenchus xylophilus]
MSASFVCLKDIRNVNEVRFLTCAVKNVVQIDYPKAEDRKGTLILEVIDKTVENPVECWIMFDRKRPFIGVIARGLVLCLRNVTVDTVNDTPVLVVDPVDDPLCRYFGFSLTQGDLHCILSYGKLEENQKAICDGEEKRLRGVRQFMSEKYPELSVDARRLFKVQVTELETFLKIKQEEEERQVEGDIDTSSVVCETEIEQRNLQMDVVGTHNNENVDPQTSWQDPVLLAIQNPVRQAPKPQLDFTCQLTPIQYTNPCRYYNIACQVVGVYDRNPSNVAVRITDGTFVKNRQLVKIPLFDADGTVNQDLADKFSDRLYDVDFYDEYADVARLFSPGDLVVIVNVHTYVNNRSGEIFTVHRNGQRFKRGIYEIKADSTIGTALLNNLARAQQKSPANRP